MTSLPGARDVYREVGVAESRIRPHIRETILEPSPLLSQRTRAEVFLKLENLQITGSFKLRGALARLLALPPGEQEVVTASTGNHALAVAYALRLTGRRGSIYLPEKVPAAKLEALRSLGAEFRQEGRDPIEAETKARQVAETSGRLYVSPYNDLQVIGGQGTVGLEIARQLPEVDAVFVAVGGGGLISGIAACLKQIRPQVSIVGCLPEKAPVMSESVRAGKIVQVPFQPTLSDATAGGLEEGAITLPLCRDLVDEYVLVSEQQIRDAMRLLIRSHHLLVEGSAAVALAALIDQPARFRSRKVVLVMCGGNVDYEVIQSLICE